MGHYAAEMMCPACGELRCTCPPAPDPSERKWAVRNYTAVPAKTLGVFERMACELYATAAEAEEAIPGLIAAQIRALESQIQRLRTLQAAAVQRRVAVLVAAEPKAPEG